VGAKKKAAGKETTQEATVDARALARVKAKVAAFVASNDDARLRPPLPEREVLAFEKTIGVRLPAEYRAFLLEVASGEEGRRFLTPEQAVRELDPGASPGQPFPLGPKDAKRLLPRSQDETPRLAASVEGRAGGHLVLVDHGCAEYSCLVVSGPERGKMWRSWDQGWSPETALRGTKPAQVGFFAWLGGWLDQNTPPPISVDASTKQLYLARRLKKGAIPRVVWTGENLESLELGGNEIAEWPRELLGLRKLRRLSVFGNRLVDVPDWLAEMKLQSLNLVANPLAGFPAAVTRMATLEELIVTEAGLTSVPESIGALSSLTTLRLAGNKLESLPESIGDLARLTTLELDRNHLRALPASIGRLKSLRVLKIEDNPLEELPDAIGELPSLQSLELRRMPLRRVPDTLCGLAGLVALSLEKTEPASLPDSIGDIPNLKTLAVSHTPAMKSLPRGLARTRSLETLMLIDLPGLDPAHGLDVLAALATVSKLYFSENAVRRLPEAIAGMTALAAIEVGKNGLDELPAFLARLPKLSVVNAYDNRIQRVPDEILAMPRLVKLNLFGNPVPLEERARIAAARPDLAVRFSN
jgi:Leucine-rich repeat (LRR) protein